MRVFFTKGKQKIFIDAILSKISLKDVAKLCNLSERTIRDWRREKFSVELSTLRLLCQKTRIPFPSNVDIRGDYWYTIYGSTGGVATYKKYGRIGGDPGYRKKKWYEWWEKKGKFLNQGGLFREKQITRPRKGTALSEFVGIILGDGSIAQNQITITLHSKDDKEYSQFVIAMIKRLFDAPVCIYYKKGSLGMNLVISRTALVSFCTEKLELKIGNKIKQQVGIPEWIKENNSYSIACVRGLVDTDGCVFTHRYKVNGKTYEYKKLCYTSYSGPLRKSVFNILKNNGLNPRFYQNRDIRLDSVSDMKKYLKIFGFHNPKHLKRYKDTGGVA